jgi:hypothetical protein
MSLHRGRCGNDAARQPVPRALRIIGMRGLLGRLFLTAYGSRPWANLEPEALAKRGEWSPRK